MKRLWLLLTLKPAEMRWRRWLRLNRVVSRALAQRRRDLELAEGVEPSTMRG